MARKIAKKRGINDCSFVHLTSTLLPHYLVKCRSCRLAIYNNEFILGSAYCLRKSLWDNKIIEKCYLLNINQEQVYGVYHTKISEVNELKLRINSEWAALSHTVIECAVGACHQGLCTCVHAGGLHFEHTL